MLEKSEGAVKPWEIADWTLSEIFLFLEKADARSPSGALSLDDADLDAAFSAWQGLGPLERLRQYQW